MRVGLVNDRHEQLLELLNLEGEILQFDFQIFVAILHSGVSIEQRLTFGLFLLAIFLCGAFVLLLLAQSPFNCAQFRFLRR